MPTIEESALDASYDYIIVGAGSAGCVLANRLSASPDHRVLLLEAGPRDWSPLIHIPAAFVFLISNPRVDWMYETEPEHGLSNRRIPWPRGKVLGGSSSMNGMCYIRGQVQDYDHWRQLGNEGWSWEEVLPYFRRSENNERGADDLHAVGGPLNVADIDSGDKHEISDALIDALVSLGVPHRDVNGLDQEGCCYYQNTVKDGRRHSTAVAFLNPIRKRTNLHVRTHAFVEKVLFEGTRAVGIQYNVKGTRHEARCAGEVILSGGTVNSPQLLELSGIGEATLLRSLGIRVVRDLKGVGENLQDHFYTRCAYRVTKPITINERTHGISALREGLKYVFQRRGFLGMAPSHVAAFVKTRPELATPDVQFHITPATRAPGSNYLDSEPGMTCAPNQNRPESRGSIHIRSLDPTTHPSIRANYLDAEIDQQTTVAALRFARRIFHASALDPYRGQELAPGQDVQSDDELLAYAREFGSSIYHPAGTCKMGSDASAVVDTRLRVHGVQGLRVVDASVMPTLVSGNTNAPVIMMAEKASDMILQDLRRT